MAVPRTHNNGPCPSADLFRSGGVALFPERTLIVAPYVAMGVLFGFVSATIQRMTSERRMRFSGSSKVNEYPTVFGFSGVMTSPLPDSGGPISAQNSRASDVTGELCGLTLLQSPQIPD
jgi:hypothetical protein